MMPWHLKTVCLDRFPCGQNVTKIMKATDTQGNNEWERAGKSLKTLGGWQLRKGITTFLRESDSQCGGQGSIQSQLPPAHRPRIGRLNFWQSLVSNLHFRHVSFQTPELRSGEGGKSLDFSYFRQGFASSRRQGNHFSYIRPVLTVAS